MMHQPAAEQNVPIALLPGLRVDDPLAAYWLCQVTLRVRREICWLWHLHGLLDGSPATPGLLPPSSDPAGEVLDLARFDTQRELFFRTDEAAQHLSELIDTPPESTFGTPPVQGSFRDLVRRLDLAPHDCLVLAMALLRRIDSACETAFAACLNLANRAPATLALAQRLWHAPAEIFACLDPATPLARTGILAPAPLEWDSPLEVPPAITRQLLFPGPDDCAALRPISPDAVTGLRIDDWGLAVGRLRSARREDRLVVIPVSGPEGAPFDRAAAALAKEFEISVLSPVGQPTPQQVTTLLTLSWLRGAACYLTLEQICREGHLATMPDTPLLVFVGCADPTKLRSLPPRVTEPVVTVRPMRYGERLQQWRSSLPAARSDPALADALADCARRFRNDSAAIERICSVLTALGEPPRVADIHAACRRDLGLDDLAQPVAPRFSRDELMLAAKPAAQIDAIIQAMGALTRVHYEWGTAQAWNEAGLSALFSGPPGTGKTMAAEVIAAALNLPLYRIDLSQVVSKYIGETEKNLRRLFDAADTADVILFFDEADALFGKRSEVKDSHDRYANLEVSYLLERMERFKGLAILASNRKKELDEAFLRRLRYIVDFPLPGPAERARIWRLAIPDTVDIDGVDLDFLAERLPLAGGHIRSIVLNACLQTARPDAPRALAMPTVVRAARDEMEKLGRTISRDQFGPYAQHLNESGDGR